MNSSDEAVHLDLPTRAFLKLPDEQRIARIDRDLWIGYRLAREAHERLEQVLNSERRMRPDNLLIVGASNNGKTAIARRFLSLHTVLEDTAAERATIPVALIVAPNGAKIPLLFASILSALGRTPGRRSTIAKLRTETYRAMKDVGLRLLLIDDFHNIRGNGVGSFLVELRNMGSLTRISLGAFATKEISYALRQDEQMANRFALMTLPRWRFDDVEYPKLLATFKMRLPLRKRSNLTEPSLAHEILISANGLIGGIAGVLREAAAEAIKTGHEKIDRSMLVRVSGAPWIPAKVIALFCEEILGVETSVRHIAGLGSWMLDKHAFEQEASSATEWGTARRHAGHLVDCQTAPITVQVALDSTNGL